MTDFEYPVFLAARLDESEMRIKYARDVAEWGSIYTAGEMLADIAAKRTILTEYDRQVRNSKEHRLSAVIAGYRDAYLEVIRSLCRPFADHPDYPGGPR